MVIFLAPAFSLLPFYKHLYSYVGHSLRANLERNYYADKYGVKYRVVLNPTTSYSNLSYDVTFVVQRVVPKFVTTL